MSETFDAALRGLYADVAVAPGAGLDAAVPLMVARTRRSRRVRTAGVTLATAAAVVGVAVAGAAVVRGVGGATVPPATGPTVTGAVSKPVCGTAVTDLAALPATSGLVLRAGLDLPELAAGELTGWLGTTLQADAAVEIRAEIPGDYGFVVSQGGVVVGTTRAVLRADSEDGHPRTHTARVTPTSCAGGALPSGEYDLVAVLPLKFEAGPGEWVDAVLVSEPAAFTVPEPSPLLPPDQHVPPDGVSAVPPADPSAPLPDGDYLARVSDVDPVAGTVTADVVVLYFGQAAEDWAAANAPGTEVTDDYVTDDPDGPAERTLPVDDAPVWEWCSGGSGIELVQRADGLPEWAAASSEIGERICADGAAIPRWGYYWLDVRGGVVVQVVGQYVP